MRILIDAMILGRTLTGMEYHLADLLQALPEVDQVNDYYLAGEAGDLLNNTYYRPLPPVGHTVFDLVHFPACYWRSLAAEGRLLFTIHDLLNWHRPGDLPPGVADRISGQQRMMVTKAAGIITCSRTMKEEIVRLLGVPEQLVFVIPLAPAPLFKPVTDIGVLSMIRAKYGVNKFILTVSSLKQRKNIPLLVNAFALLKTDPYFQDLSLLIVGKRQGKEEERTTAEILAVASRCGVQGDLVIPGYLPREDLPAIYSAAEVFVHPSLYEGFGLPPLEAMACGTPVVVVNNLVTDEVVGNGALVVDAGSPAQLAGVLAALLINRSEAECQRARGLEWVRQFSWQRTARETVNAYRQVSGHG